ncbi:MAG: hypothetical protein ACOX0Z_01620 [Candidatus Nanosyncoccaceae bacterium]|jgi:hypothetical protein
MEDLTKKNGEESNIEKELTAEEMTEIGQAVVAGCVDAMPVENKRRVLCKSELAKMSTEELLQRDRVDRAIDNFFEGCHFVGHFFSDETIAVISAALEDAKNIKHLTIERAGGAEKIIAYDYSDYAFKCDVTSGEFMRMLAEIKGGSYCPPEREEWDDDDDENHDVYWRGEIVMPDGRRLCEDDLRLDQDAIELAERLDCGAYVYEIPKGVKWWIGREYDPDRNDINHETIEWLGDESKEGYRDEGWNWRDQYRYTDEDDGYENEE